MISEQAVKGLAIDLGIPLPNIEKDRHGMVALVDL
jgi:hypothetical protein